MRFFAIGDVHGCYNELVKMFEFVDNQVKEGDQIILLGDYIDRGPMSKQVIELLIERRNTHKNKHVFLYGNHEDLMKTGDYWFPNGGNKVVESYGHMHYDYNMQSDFYKFYMPKDHVEFIESLLPYYKVGNMVFVHACVNPYKPLEEHILHDLIWDRSYDGYVGTYPEHDPDMIVVRGHTPVQSAMRKGQQWYIDTGCVFGEHLSCLVIDPENPDEAFVHKVKSEQPTW